MWTAVYLPVSLSLVICKMPILLVCCECEGVRGSVLVQIFPFTFPPSYALSRGPTKWETWPLSGSAQPAPDNHPLLRTLVSSHWVQTSWLWAAGHGPFVQGGEDNDFISVEGPTRTRLLSTRRLGMEEEVGGNEQGKFTEGYGPFLSMHKNEWVNEEDMLLMDTNPAHWIALSIAN